MRLRLIALASAAALVTVGIATAKATSTAVPKLRGTIGPGFTISLKNAQGKTFKTLKPGKYTLVVSDQASIHNFTLNGPGIKNKMITSTSFVGSKTATLTLAKGSYRFYCTVHPTISGTFTVA